MAEETTTAVEEPVEPVEDGKTFTADYVKKLRDEAAKYRNEAKELRPAAEKLAALEESKRSDLEKATARAEAAESEAVNTRRENIALIRFKDPALSSLLSGNTREEIEASAEILASHITASKPVEPKALKSGASGGDGSGLTVQERAAHAVRELRGTSN